MTAKASSATTRILGLILANLLIGTGMPPALGQSTAWTQPQDGLWSDDGNWTASAPTSDTDVFINVAGAVPYTVTVSFLSFDVAESLTMNPAAPGMTLHILGSGSLNVEELTTIGTNSTVLIEAFSGLHSGLSLLFDDVKLLVNGTLVLDQNAEDISGVQLNAGGEIRIQELTSCLGCSGLVVVGLHNGVNDGWIRGMTTLPTSTVIGLTWSGGPICCDVVNSETGVISISGEDIDMDAPVVNFGLIEGFGSIDFLGTPTFSNHGTIQASDGMLFLTQFWTNEPDGEVVLAGGRLRGFGGFSNLGTIHGTGEVDTDVFNEGVILVEDGAELDFQELLTNQPGGVVQLAGGVLRKVEGDGFENRGLLTGFGEVNGSFLNTGVIDVADGQVVTIRDEFDFERWVNDSSGLVDLTGGTLDGGTIENLGTIHARTGSSTILSDAVYLYSGGQILIDAELITTGLVDLNDQVVSSTVEGGSPLWLNDGRILGEGTISVALENRALLDLRGRLVMTEPWINSGLVELSSLVGDQLVIHQDATNEGFITLSGQISGPGNLINGPSGSIIGGGTISLPVENVGGQIVSGVKGFPTFAQLALNSFEDSTNDGRLLVSNYSGMTVETAFMNAGQILLEGNTAQFGGGDVTNTGSVSGGGGFNADMVNGGLVEANIAGAPLVLSGALTNEITGTLLASPGATLRITGELPTNEGLIRCNDGTFDTNGAVLANNGIITGYGTYRTGGLTNNNLTNFTTNLSFIDGDVENPGVMRVTAGVAVFTGAVTCTGLFDVAPDGQAIFVGPFSCEEAGTLAVGGSYQKFDHLSFDPDSVLTTAEDSLIEVTGALDNASTQSASWDTGGATVLVRSGLAGQEVLLEAASADVGCQSSVLDNDFGVHSLHIAGSGTTARLVDVHDNGTPEADAWYAGVVILDDNTTIDLGGVNLYYNELIMGEAVTVLSFGGELVGPCCPADGDSDGDADVDLLDFGGFQICYSGMDAPIIQPDCEWADFDCDDDVDLLDFGQFQLAYTG